MRIAVQRFAMHSSKFLVNAVHGMRGRRAYAFIHSSVCGNDFVPAILILGLCTV